MVPSRTPLRPWKAAREITAAMAVSTASVATLALPKRIPKRRDTAWTVASPGSMSTLAKTWIVTPRASTAIPSRRTSSWKG